MLLEFVDRLYNIEYLNICIVANYLLKKFKFTMSLMQKISKLWGEFIIKWDTVVIVISNPFIKVHVN